MSDVGKWTCMNKHRSSLEREEQNKKHKGEHIYALPPDQPEDEQRNHTGKTISVTQADIA